MNRRRFFAALAALPFVGRIAAQTKPGARFFGSARPLGILAHPMLIRYTATDKEWMQTVVFTKEDIFRMYKLSPHFVGAINETHRIAEAVSARARNRRPLLPPPIPSSANG